MIKGTEWNFMPHCKMPRIGTPVLTVKGDEKYTFVREGTYKGRGYWAGYGNAPVLAWTPMPYVPVSLALASVFREKEAILDTKPYGMPKSPPLMKRLAELEAIVDAAMQDRETEDEKRVRQYADALQRIVEKP